jgi:hypothetical protein
MFKDTPPEEMRRPVLQLQLHAMQFICTIPHRSSATVALQCITASATLMHVPTPQETYQLQSKDEQDK